MTWDTFDLALWREYCEQIAPALDKEPPFTDKSAFRSGSWRNLPPTLKQEKLLKKFGKTATTRGEATTMISALPPRVRWRP